MAEKLTDLLAKVREKSPGLVATLEGRYVAVGDLHGDYKTLQQLLREWEGPYLFLGDYVDRGDNGLEVVTEVFRLFVEGKAVALRGNHESPTMNIDGGFLDELCDKLGRGRCGAVYREFEKTFARLPLAALVNGRFVALHGGIPLRDDMTPATLEEIGKASGDLTIPTDPLAFQTVERPLRLRRLRPKPQGARHVALRPQNNTALPQKTRHGGSHKRTHLHPGGMRGTSRRRSHHHLHVVGRPLPKNQDQNSCRR